MIVNIGMTDGAMRVLIGATLIGLAAFGTVGAWGYLGIVAVDRAAAALPRLSDLRHLDLRRGAALT